jgi:hypothetical protein
MNRVVPMPGDSAVLVLPLSASAQPESTGVIRDYLRHMDARRYRRALRAWEGEGGKLASARTSRARSGGPDFSHLMFR